MRVLCLLAAGSAALLAQTNRTACAVSAEAEQEVRALPAMSDFSLSFEERMGPRRALAAKYPDDWALQVHLQDPILRLSHLGREWDRAIAHYRSLPDRTLGELLEARLLSRLHRKKSREMLDRVLAQAGDSPWAHEALLHWTGALEAGERVFEQLRRMCPESLWPFRYLESVRDVDRMHAHVLALRRALDGRKQGILEEGDYGLFRTLWKWESVLYGPDRREEFYRLVRSDLEALRGKPTYNSQDWYFVVRSGYEHTLKDPAALEALRREAAEKAPDSLTAHQFLAEKLPHDDASRIEQALRFPTNGSARMEALHVLLNSRSQVTPEQVARLSDLLLSAAERLPDQSASWPPLSITLAEIYVRHRIRLDRVPEMVQKGLEDIEYQERYRRDADVFANIPDSMRHDNVQFTHDKVREIRARHALATGDRERALALLGDLRRELEASKPEDDRSRAAQHWQRKHSAYLRLAKEAGLDVQPVAELALSDPKEVKRYPVADFEAKDMSGRTWRLADLKGKVAYVNVWTSGARPAGPKCRVYRSSTSAGRTARTA
jgi:hypothetical protein